MPGEWKASIATNELWNSSASTDGSQKSMTHTVMPWWTGPCGIVQAVEYVKSGMVVGLGTGSTAAFAVARIGELLKVCGEESCRFTDKLHLASAGPSRVALLLALVLSAAASTSGCACYTTLA